MSLETVASALGVRHTTVSRWERGLMKLSTSDLERLAIIYGATLSQLQAAPQSAGIVARLDRTQQIVKRMSPDDLERWLALGESLISRK